MGLQFVLVQDTCFGPWAWDHLKADLEAAKKSVTLVNLPTPSSTVYNVDDYSQPLLNVMQSLPAGDSAVLVAHGMGGINAAIAMDNYPAKIAVAIFVNAFMPDTANQPSFVIDKYLEIFKNWDDTVMGRFPCGGGGMLTTMKLGNHFLQGRMYNLSPKLDLDKAQVWGTVGSLFQDSLNKRPKFTSLGYGSVNRAYVASVQDEAMPVKEFQAWQVQNYPLGDPKDYYEVNNADHMVMISEHSKLSVLVQTVADKYSH